MNRAPTQATASTDLTRAAPPALQRACACGAAKGVEAQCPNCAAKARLGVQPKLTVNRPGDRYEQEADRIADRVVSDGPPGPVAATAPTLQREMAEEEDELQAKPAAVQRMEEEEDELQMKPAGLQRMEEEEDELQMKPAGVQRMEEEEDELQMKPAGPAPTSPAVSQAAAAVSGGGQPLSRAERSYFEPRIGRDLSAVRLHDDARAGTAARGINARAYTLDNHIAFAPGTRDFASTEGRRLMAHELVHTVQQQPTATIARAAKPRSPEELAKIAGDPARAHRVWDSLTEADQKYVLERMQDRYARSSNPNHNSAWVDEFETLRGNGFDPGNLVHEYRDPAPIMNEEMLARGYSLASSSVALAKLTETWVRPSGKIAYLVRDVANEDVDEPKEDSGDGSESEDGVRELVPDFAQWEIEEMFGFPVPHFVMASILSEDDEGNRTIQILQARVDDDGWEEPKINKITCLADDTCNVEPQMFAFD